MFFSPDTLASVISSMKERRSDHTIRPEVFVIFGFFLILVLPNAENWSCNKTCVVQEGPFSGLKQFRHFLQPLWQIWRYQGRKGILNKPQVQSFFIRFEFFLFLKQIRPSYENLDHDVYVMYIGPLLEAKQGSLTHIQNNHIIFYHILRLLVCV